MFEATAQADQSKEELGGSKISIDGSSWLHMLHMISYGVDLMSAWTRCCQGDASTHAECWDEAYSFEARVVHRISLEYLES